MSRFFAILGWIMYAITTVDCFTRRGDVVIARDFAQVAAMFAIAAYYGRRTSGETRRA